MKVEFYEECKSCGGTGVYIGMAERAGASVVCHNCNGTGCFHFVHEYEEFSSRKINPAATWVYKTNPGIAIGKREGFCDFPDFGGMSYRDWKNGLPFPDKSEMRKFCCPAWWYQSADYSKSPKWDECESQLGRSYSKCPCFYTKKLCWERWDKEFGVEGR